MDWREHQLDEVAFWMRFGTRLAAVNAHHDFFELIWRCFCKTLHDKQFLSALEVGIGASGGFLGVIKDIKHRHAVDTLVDFFSRHSFLPLTSHIKYRNANAENLPYQDNSFDLLICTNALDHVENREKVVTEIKRVLKPEGYFLFQTYLNVPNPHPFTFRSTDEVDKLIGMKKIENHVIDDNDKFRARCDYYVAIYQK